MAKNKDRFEMPGPTKDRSCTDVLCLLVFVAFLIGWGVVGYFGFTLGDPERLVHPTDSNGLVCGYDAAVKDRPFLHFFDLTRCANPQVLTKGCPTPQVCVAKCPTETFYFKGASFMPDKVTQLICKTNISVTVANADELVNKGDCSRWYINSTAVAGRCIPRLSPDLDLDGLVPNLDGPSPIVVKEVVTGSEFIAKLVNAGQVVERIFQDFNNSWWMILIGLVVAMVVSLLWILLMRFVAAFMVWLSILAVLAIQAVGVWYCYTQWDSLKDDPDANLGLAEVAFTTNLSTYLAQRDTWLVFLIILAVLIAITLLILLFLRQRIRIAIALIAHASKAVSHIMSSLVFPLVPWLLQVAFIAYFVAVAVYLASAGKSTFRAVGLDNRTDCNCPLIKENFLCTPETFDTFCPQDKCPGAVCQYFANDAQSTNTYLQLYNLFGLFWGLFFASALGEMVLAGAFATWYWSFNKPHDVPFYTVTLSFLRTLRYHLGTVAFGSLIVALIRSVRVLLEYVDHKTRELRQDNWLAKFVLCCCRCCLWCLEKFIRFINRNAYIVCAIKGSNFCSSAKDAFSMILRNAARVFVIDTVTEFLLFLGRLVVVCGVGVTSFYVFSGQVDALNDQLPSLNYYFVPVITLIIGTWFISSVFFSVYAMAIDTIFLCFLEDTEINDGSPDKPFYMSKELMSILGRKNK